VASLSLVSLHCATGFQGDKNNRILCKTQWGIQFGRGLNREGGVESCGLRVSGFWILVAGCGFWILVAGSNWYFGALMLGVWSTSCKLMVRGKGKKKGTWLVFLNYRLYRCTICRFAFFEGFFQVIN